MALTGEEIRSRLAAFAARWSVYEGSERSEAQTFLNELFECYGQSRSTVAWFEHAQAGRFLDLIWPRVCVIEMKAPAEANRLARHRDQALAYWRESADPAAGIPASRFVVICAFRRLEIWEPGSFPGGPRLALDLIDLPDQYDALLFLAGDEPVFLGGQAALTRDAVVHVTDLYDQLKERRAADFDVLRDFVLQCVWCLFAEDLGQVPEHRFTRILDDLIANPRRSSGDDLHGLFAWLNDPRPARPDHGLYAGVPYADGGLFANPARVHLTVDELKLLRSSADFNWRLVEPAIFGSLLEGGLGHDKQWALGAHYTHEADIRKVVQPTIVEPWTQRIENLSTHAQAVAAQNDLLSYVVLDPACGSGNFLYVAYRELRRLEQRLAQRETELRRKDGLRAQASISLHFPISNIRGIEIDGFAVALARVTLWMGHKLAVDELGLSEATLPLAPLTGIQTGDALRMPWPRADAVIGNPPFIGTKFIRSRLGDEYVNFLKSEFDIGVKEYCVYWFRKAHDHLVRDGRAGFVATNSIGEGRNREVSLDHIVATGGLLTNAISTQKWPGEANVFVSIVNWIKEPRAAPSVFRLDGVDVEGITSALREGRERPAPELLAQNTGRQFFGVVPGGAGFILSPAEAAALLRRSDADYGEVVRPYLVGSDLMQHPRQAPTRFVIDFGLRSLEEALAYPAAIERVRALVKPHRDTARRKAYRERWWRLEEPIVAMRAALAGLPRYIACPAQSKRFFMAWCALDVCPSNLTSVFAFSDDFSMGVLASEIHRRWAVVESTRLKSDPRYTNASFMSFPWPSTNREAVAGISRELLTHRDAICREQQIGLTMLYNQVDDGAWTNLRDLHRDLDEAVAIAYGWPASVAHDADETNRRLLELNREIAAGERAYDPFPS